MKKHIYIVSAALMMLFASCSSSRNFAQSYYEPSTQGVVTYQQFYDELSPYGNWIMYPGYGYVWSPYEAGFQPYQTNGYWAYTQAGWTWVSNYRWGWAPFHYGRWLRDVRYGWMWVPGYQWAPAWVAWRGGGGYYGWAPLGPGMSINISFSSIPYNNWCFVPSRYINSHSMGNYFVNRSRNVTIINNTTIINNYNGGQNDRNYNAGPRIMDVERQTNRKIAPVRIVNRTTPGSPQIDRNQIAMYRPNVKETPKTVQPRRFETAPVRDVNTTPRTSGSEFQNNGLDQPNRQTQSRENEIRQIENKRVFEKNNTTPVNVEQRTTPLQQPNVQPEQKQQPVRRFTPVDDRRIGQPKQVEKNVRQTPVQNERKVVPKSQPQQAPQQRQSVPVIKQPQVQRPAPQQPKRVETPVKTNKRTFGNG